MSFKICSIGCGRHAAKVHGPSLKKYAGLNFDVELAGCCDLNGDAAQSYARSFGFKSYYSDMEEMLRVEDPDAVSLVLPEHLTAGVAKQVLEMGIPLILEKPPGLTKAEAEPLIAVALKKKVPNRVAFNRRYAPMVRALKKLIHEASEIEEVHNIEYYMSRVDRRDPDFSTTAIHAIDAVRFIAEADYKNIHFHYQELPGMGPGVANLTMQCEMESGARATLSFFPVSGALLERAKIHGSGYSLFLDIPMFGGADVPGKLVHFQDGAMIRELSGAEISDGAEMFEMSGFYFENASFFDELRRGAKTSGGLETTLQSVEVAECMRNREKSYAKL